MSLPETTIKGLFGETATMLVGTVAGYSLCKPPLDFGVDFDVKKIRVREDGRHLEVSVFQIQVKSSSNYEIKDDHVVYDLEVDTYNDMVDRNIHGDPPIVLVLMALRENTGASLTVRDDEIAISKSLYWYRVDSKDMSGNKETVRIKIPAAQKLDVATFASLARDLDV